MKRKRMFFVFMLFPIVLACVVPGLPAAAPLATPTEDNRLQVMIVETVAAATTQTAQAASPTPSPTFTPTITPSPTITPTPLPLIESLLVEQADGSMFFTDEHAGYTLTIPSGWLTARLNGQEFFDALVSTETTDPLAYQALINLRGEDPYILRLFALYRQGEGALNEAGVTMRFELDETRTLTFDSEESLQILADELTASQPDLEITSTAIVVAPSKILFGVIESEIKGVGTLTFQKRVYFKAKSGIASATLTTDQTMKVEIIPVFDAVMDTIRMTEP